MRRYWIPLCIVVLCFPLTYPSNAITMFYGSGFGSHGMWTRLLDTNTSVFVSAADFFHNPWEADDVHQLADQGFKVNYRIYWWWRFYNGEIAWNTSVVDLYYNTSLMELLEQEIDWQLSYLNASKIWAVTLSEEEPQGAYRFFWTPAALQKYNDTYYSETGFWLRDRYDLNKTEGMVLDQWLTGKFVWTYNHLYDYIKGKWPHLLVFQFTWLWPGASPVWGGGLEISDLKADAHMGDLYYYEAYDNPFWLYELVRQAKTTFPDKEYHFWLWGEEAWTEGGLSGGFEHIRRNAWIAYLAGIDAIGWFNWHYIHGNMWEREDTLGKRFYTYTNRLNNELAKLPTLKPRPQVLVIRDQMMSFQLGLCADLGLLNEWDTVSQTALVKKKLDLSQYRMIIANEDRYLDEVVEKLNEYVKSGGNLVLLGGFGWDQRNFYDNATRRSKFLIEEGVAQEHIWGDINMKVSEPNPLGLNLQYRHSKSSILAIAKNTMTENHHPIGEFHLVGDEGKLTQIEDCPLVLYHNSSSQNEGSILYWGIPSGPVPARGVFDIQYEDVVEAFLPEWNYTRFLYRTISSAFAMNYLNLNGSIAVNQTENMIITQSKIDDGTILAGVSNYYPETVNINYTLDLNRFNIPAGEYWVHSLDENLTLGPYESKQSLLVVPLSIVANGTRLLLISQQKPDPSYSVNIFPDIPTTEEVEDLWSVGIPSASFTYSPTDPSTEDSISFIDTSTDPDGAIVSWYWDLGDGNTSIEQFPTNKYTQEGQYTVSLKVTDNNGCTDTREQTITIRIPPPTASFTHSPNNPTVGQEVSFTDASTIPERRTVTSWSWNFGDGDTTALQNPTHKYENPGSYTVTLTVRDSEGLVDTYSTIIDVKPDYTVYFVIGGLLIAAVIAVVIFGFTRRKK